VQRRDRGADERHVAAVEVGDDAVEVVGDQGAAGASLPFVRKPEPDAEHEVVDEELGAPPKEVRQALCAVLGVEAVRLLDRNPRQLLTHARDLVASVKVALLGFEQSSARRQPFLAGPSCVCRHRRSSPIVGRCVYS
jgi:hypothetical protein